MDVSIVIPNYNGEDLLNKNLPFVFAAASYYETKEGDDVEIIVVDDNSKDNSIDVVKKISSEIRVIKNKKNEGFATTVNKGVSNAKGDIVVLLNTDVKPQKDFLTPLARPFVKENVFAVGCMDKSIEQDSTILRGRGLGWWEKGFLVHRRGEVEKNNTLWVNGGSGGFRKSIWEKLGGLNTLYKPFYWEDIDISYRALKSGYDVLFEPKSVVVHEHERGAIKKRYSPFMIRCVAYKNQFIFVWENATDLDLQFLHVLWLPYHFIKAFIRLDIAFFIGFFWALGSFFKILQTSLKAQEFFVKTDREVVREFQQ